MKRLFEPDHGDAVFDPLIRRTLDGEAIPFDEWLEAEYALEEEADVTPSAAEIEEAAETRADFLRRLEGFKLLLNNRFQLCESLYAKAIKAPSDELLCLYCDIVCDTGYLLDLDRAERTPAQDALCMLRRRKDSKSLYDFLSERRRCGERFREIMRLSIKASSLDSAYREEDASLSQRIAAAYLETMKPKGDCAKLSDNIASLMQSARGNAALRAIEPLFLYRALTRHAQRLQKDDTPQFDMEAIWRYQYYQLEENNGKNYKTCVRYLALFKALCTLLADKPEVDMELCLYGFDHLSNLGQFYRLYGGNEPALDFGPEVDDVFLKYPFSCFEHGYGDNVLLKRSGMGVTELDKYRTEKNRRRACAFDRVSAYINKNLTELTTRFLEAPSPEQVVRLCEEILSAVDLPLAQKPANETEKALLLAAINAALMEAQDDWAEDYLIRAGKALVGDDPLQN